MYQGQEARFDSASVSIGDRFECEFVNMDLLTLTLNPQVYAFAFTERIWEKTSRESKWRRKLDQLQKAITILSTSNEVSLGSLDTFTEVSGCPGGTAQLCTKHPNSRLGYPWWMTAWVQRNGNLLLSFTKKTIPE